jgi:hypothetical protein
MRRGTIASRIDPPSTRLPNEMKMFCGPGTNHGTTANASRPTPSTSAST